MVNALWLDLNFVEMWDRLRFYVQAVQIVCKDDNALASNVLSYNLAKKQIKKCRRRLQFQSAMLFIVLWIGIWVSSHSPRFVCLHIHP